MKKRVAVIGAGAAGVFCAINLARLRPDVEVTVLEKTTKPLAKVKISGGGRCNVTHSCFEPSELVKYYPRGQKELLGPFYTFQPEHTVQWFKEKGVELKTEEDGRMFPVSDDSQTIIDCFMKEVQELGVQISLRNGLKSISQHSEGRWNLECENQTLDVDYVVMASGSSKQVWDIIESLGHQIITLVPSLFTFHVDDRAVHELAGLSIHNVHISQEGRKYSSTGPLLLTHWGLSAPAVLKMSAAEAVYLNEQDYRFTIQVDFHPSESEAHVLENFKGIRITSKKAVQNFCPFDFPQRFWKYIINEAQIEPSKKWADFSNRELESLCARVKKMKYDITGKSTFKEEFVTAGGVNLKEVDFRTMESKKLENLYFCGEVLNVDGFTGGFNFQAAWTTAMVTAYAISEKD